MNEKAILARLECIIELLATAHPDKPSVLLTDTGYTIAWKSHTPGIDRYATYDFDDGRYFRFAIKQPEQPE